MKLYKPLLACAALIASAAAFTACDDDPELPPLIAPESTLGKPNTSIYDLKKLYWSSERNFADTVGLTPAGEHTIIAGRVISCDSTGNIYKSLIIQDATAALAISLDTTKLWQKFPVGEEVVIDMTGRYVGKYNGLFQMGTPKPYNNTYEISFMSYTPDFTDCAQRNGLPDPAKIDTIHTTISEIKSWRSQDSIAKYQSQLISLTDVEFVGGGQLTWADNGQNANRQLRDSKGNTLTVRNSAYSSFGREVMPGGKGNVVCILSYYGTDWQILFRSALDCHDFTGGVTGPGETPMPEGGDGSADSPFNVAQVIAGQTGSSKWVTGYIVGFVEGASISDGAHFNADGASESNILLAATAGETNVDNCIPVQLTYNTDPRTALNLKSNPANIGRQVSVLGDLQTYFNVKGVKTVTSFTWGDKGGEMPSVTPSEPSDKAVYVKATAITAGKSYLLVAEGKSAAPLAEGKTYGYLPVAAVTVAGDSITAPAANAFTFEAAEGGFSIKDSRGNYLYMTGTYNSFNIDEKAVEGSLWSVKAEKDAFTIENVKMKKTLQYSKQYDSWGAYPETTGTLPALYEKVK